MAECPVELPTANQRVVFQIDPLRDPRWRELVVRHPESSVFHTPEWLRTLQRAYGYEPVVFTSSEKGRPLQNGIVFCRVKSWLTGSRLVSLPFSDHCQPLLENPDDLAGFVHGIEAAAGKGCRYVELRPLINLKQQSATMTPFVQAAEYSYHKIDLRSDSEVIFRKFHKSCIQRKIHRAEREGLIYETGRSESLMSKFYELLTITRRRHKLPAQPKRWFRHLVDCLGESLTIRVVSKDYRPVTGMLTLTHKRTLVYKYGCSDARWNHLGGMPLLFWKAVQEGKEQGAVEFDLGRSDLDDTGLATFKERLGAQRYKLSYMRLQMQATHPPLGEQRLRIARHVLAWLPDPVIQMAGSLLYRHMG